MEKFKLVSNYKPTGDQPQAIEKLSEGIKNGLKEQVLLGVTGSGKTFTMANIIANVNRPTLVLAHNKTLAAQLCRKSFIVSENECRLVYISDNIRHSKGFTTTCNTKQNLLF